MRSIANGKWEIAIMTAEYSAIFGISQDVPRLKAGEQYIRMGDGFTVAIIPSVHDRVFWFVIDKMNHKFEGGGHADLPRFTQEDLAKRLECLESIIVEYGVRLGDVWEKRTVANMVPLEEYAYQNWSSGRTVCLGDSMHKVSILVAAVFFALSTSHY